jgi:hypothetical protein
MLLFKEMPTQYIIPNMFATRRTLTIRIAACIVPPPRPVLATELRDTFARLNKRDKVLAMNKEVNEIAKWAAIKDKKKFITACENNDISKATIHELHYMFVMYDKPLSPDQKVRIRNGMLCKYDESDNDLERDILLDVMHYFELFD